MIDRQCDLHLLIRFCLLAVLLFDAFYLGAANRYLFNEPVQDVIYSNYGDGFSDRKLEQRKSLFSKMRIHFETSQLERQIAVSSIPNVKAKGELLLGSILPMVADTWSRALSVVPSKTLFFTNSTACALGFPVPEEWTTVGIDGVDLIIFVGAYGEANGEVICGSTSTVMAIASHCLIDQNGRPVVGFVNVCLDSIIIQDDGSALASDTKIFKDVVLHEVGHVLGLNSGFFRYFRNAVTNEPMIAQPFRREDVKCIDGLNKDIVGAPGTNILQYKESQETGYYEIVTPTVRQVARNQFACQSVTGARLENQPTQSNDCFGSHLDERFFLTDLMSAFYDPSAAYLSPITLAIFEDSGHYRPNYDISQNSPFGLGAGCDFVNGKCIVNDSVPAYAKGYFCDTSSDYQSPDNYGSSRWQCGPSHHDRGHCDLFRLKHYAEFPYFEDKNLGPSTFQSADYCPVIQINQLACDNENAAPLEHFEVFSSDSRCVDVSIDGSDSAVCLKATCNTNKRTFDFYVGQDVYSCKESSQVVIIDSFENLTIQCPRLTAVCPDMFCPSMCSGKGLCDWSLSVPVCKCFNDMDTTLNCNDSDPAAPSEISKLILASSPSTMPSSSFDTSSSGIEGDNTILSFKRLLSAFLVGLILQ